MTSCLVLFSGGLDSTTAIYWALSQNRNVHALTFDYGQRHKIEIAMARRLARKLSLPHAVLRIDLRQIGGSALTDANIQVPQNDIGRPGISRVLSTYVPFRNGIFLAMAAAWAEVKNIREIICGFHTIDSPDYPDTRKAFVASMEQAVNRGTRFAANGEKVKITAPFIGMKKSEIIRRGILLGAEYAYSISCYSGTEIPCQRCSACIIRRKAWKEAGFKDPLLLRLRKEGKI